MNYTVATVDGRFHGIQRALSALRVKRREGRRDSLMFTTTADSIIPSVPRGYQPPPDPLDAIKLYGKTTRWWQKKGLFVLARRMLYEHEWMVNRRLNEHHKDCVECLAGNLKCQARRRLREELD